MQDYSYNCHSFVLFSWVEEKKTVKVVTRIVHVNIILHMAIRLRDNAVDNIYKFIVNISILRQILRNISQC